MERAVDDEEQWALHQIYDGRHEDEQAHQLTHVLEREAHGEHPQDGRHARAAQHRVRHERQELQHKGTGS